MVKLWHDWLCMCVFILLSKLGLADWVPDLREEAWAQENQPLPQALVTSRMRERDQSRICVWKFRASVQMLCKG